MRNTSPKRRALCLALVSAMLCPNPAFARVLPDVNLGPIAIQKEREEPSCKAPGKANPVNGKFTVAAPGDPLVAASPGIDPAPTFHSGNTDLSSWGRGWTSDIDHKITLNGNNTITWTNGSGVHVTYAGVAGSTTPVYTPPVNAYETITTVAASSGVPSSLLERDTDGTTRRFDSFESTGVLRLALLTDKNGNTVEYQRDAQGRLTRVEDVHGRYFNLTYNPAGRVETLTDSGGRSSSYAYDPSGRRIGDTGPLGATAYQYDAANRMVKITYPNGGVKNYAYDAANRVLSEDDGAGVNARSFVYYKSSTTVTDALGRAVKYDYITLKGLKKIAKITDPSGGVTSFVYDANLNLLSVTDPLGRVTSYAYDAKGNVTRTDDPAGGHTVAAYEPNFNLVASLTDPLARTTNMTYDAQGNLTVVTDALSGTVNKGYDGQGHVTSSQDPLGHSTAFSYEPTNGALKSITDPLSRQTVMLTDGLSRVTRNTDPSGKVTEYTYDAASNLTQVKDALGGLTRYTYAPGRDKKLLETVTDANGHATTFGYDAQGRLTSVTNALGQTKTSTYDDKGNLVETKNARDQVISYAYDSRDRLVTKTMPEGTVSYEYDAVGNLTKVTNYNGSIVETSYDALNRVTQSKQTLPGGYTATIGYGYDANGNRTSMTTPWGSFAYLYDQLNRLTRITNPQSRQFNFHYDANGRRTRLDYPNGIRTTYGYDNAGQVLSIIHTRMSDSVVVAKAIYTYDSAGNRTSMTDLSGTHVYAYDNAHRLTEAVHPTASSPPVPIENFSYDPAGNRTGDSNILGYTYNGANRLVDNSSFTYAYDADGNQISKTDKATSQATVYEYDSENHLVNVTLPVGASWSYTYDYRGRRIQKMSETAIGQGTSYIYDGENIIATNTPADGETVLTNGPSLDQLLSQHVGDSENNFSHADALGSILIFTSTAATVLKTNRYSSFGLNSSAASENPATNRFAYIGLEYDSELDSYNARARYYNPSLGRFLSEDPLFVELTRNQDAAISQEGITKYLYAKNNPTLNTDHTGLLTCGSPGREQFIPDRDPIFGTFNFTLACAYHDSCYSQPGADRLTCDSTFLKNMVASCKDSKSCEKLADEYYRTVRKHGLFAFHKAQEDAYRKRNSCTMRERP